MPRTLFFFYILVAYVLVQFVWWAYMLVELNDETAQYRIELIEKSSIEAIKMKEAARIEDKRLYQRRMMVAGEGMVFLGLLIFGISRIRSSFIREVELARQQKNFLLSITHEFKSPLAAVKLNLQTLQQRRTLQEDKKEELIRRSILETDRIHSLVENALLAARLESHSFDMHLEAIDLSTFVQQCVDDFTSRQHNSHQITHEIEPNLYVKGDQLALTSLLFNLIENAEKYSPEGSKIHVRLTQQKTEAVISVADFGIGIPEAERKHIFEKFYRVGNEETRKTKGTGLGLFIVSHIAHIHGGKVTVRPNSPSGSIFEIHLPLT